MGDRDHRRQVLANRDASVPHRGCRVSGGRSAAAGRGPVLYLDTGEVLQAPSFAGQLEREVQLFAMDYKRFVVTSALADRDTTTGISSSNKICAGAGAIRVSDGTSERILSGGDQTITTMDLERHQRELFVVFEEVEDPLHRRRNQKNVVVQKNRNVDCS